MTELYSLPRVAIPAALLIARPLAALPVAEVQKRAGISHPLMMPPRSGLPPLPNEQLIALQASLTELAGQASYPGKPHPLQFREFDLAVARFLHMELKVADTDLLRPETWAYLSTVVVPHLVRWRFPQGQVARYAGPLARNAFSRLWLAARVLDRGPGPKRWSYLANASADFLVQLLERSSLSADRRVALGIAETWNTWRKTDMDVTLETLNRDALKRLVFQAAAIEISALSQAQLESLIDNAFMDAALAQKKQGRPQLS